MGVTQLWPILQPCARPTKLETLNRKRLAVDASIWIYQFLKAVRDKEGNALRNSHVVGFFRRICKLLFFGIKPVFVFDGGAPALKRQTVLARKRRREGRRDDATRTAGKLLAVQMQRHLEQAEEKRKREVEVRGRVVEDEPEEELPDEQNLVYVGEMGMSNQERQQTRKFTKKDAYHLPDLHGGIEGMGQPNDPRIMSAEELEEYARQFNSGEDINLYDFSKIDFNGEFFMSLPAGDRYNILNAARLRSRLRMGLSKEQLEEMFPDRMAFSKFQIERVRERNELTQRLMNLNGMNSEEAMFGVGSGRIAGDRGREYVLVKNDGVEGGWALGVVSTDKSQGARDKPIDVDELTRKVKQEQQAEESEDDFEDVPIEGLNRLPKVKAIAEGMTYEDWQAREVAEQRKQFYASRKEPKKPSKAHPASGPRVQQEEDEDSLFVGEGNNSRPHTGVPADEASLFDDEDEELRRAIAMSLQKQHGPESENEDENADFEDVPMPQYEQKAVEAPKPIGRAGGRMVAHIVNNRANAAVPKRRAISVDSDDEMDMRAAIAASKKENTVPNKRLQPAPTAPNIKNPFDGPLPFEKLDFKTSLFGKKSKPAPAIDAIEDDEDAGGFQRDEQEASKPLPPWLVKEGDIRTDVREQQALDTELNAADRARAIEEEKRWKRDHGIIDVDASDDESDVEEVQAPAKPAKPIDLTAEETQEPQADSAELEIETAGELAEDIRANPPQSDIPQDPRPSPPAGSPSADYFPGDIRTELPQSDRPQEPKPSLPAASIIGPSEAQNTNEKDQSSEEEFIEWSDSDREDHPIKSVKSPGAGNLLEAGHGSSPASPSQSAQNSAEKQASRSPSPTFEDVVISDVDEETSPAEELVTKPPVPTLATEDTFDRMEADIVADIDFDEFSDPEDEELLTQLAMEAEEHARFASTLNKRSEKENQDTYEQELKQLRNQQKKDRRDADEVSHIMITECQALLRLFGLPYITAPMEAEAQCAELVNLGLVDGIVTDDSDIFLFGGTRVYKNMFNSNKFVECYLSSDLEKELSLSRDQLIAIAHLLGSDYTEGLPGIGPVTALEILSEFPSSAGLLEFKEWFSDVQSNKRSKEEDAKSSFRKKFRRSQATKLFLPPAFPSPAVTDAYLKPDVDSTPEAFQWGVPDLDGLRTFLMATIGWTQERTDEVLLPVVQDMNRREREGTQSNITRFFEGGVGVGAKDNFAPRVRDAGSSRMKEAVKKLKAKTVNSLSTTFADEAAEWAKKNELSETAQLAKDKQRKKKGKGRKRAVEDEEDDADEDEDDDDDVRNSTRKGRKAQAKGKRTKVSA